MNQGTVLWYSFRIREPSDPSPLILWFISFYLTTRLSFQLEVVHARK